MAPVLASLGDLLETAVSIRQSLRGSSQSIWRALTVPEAIAAWQTDRVQGEVELGGHLLFAWPALGAEIDLDVLELEPERRLTLSSGSSRVSFDVEGSTLVLTHSGLTEGDEAEGTRSSWLVALATLDHYLAHHDGRVRRTSWVIERAPSTAPLAHAYFTDAMALSTWLTRSGGIGEPGSEVDLVLGWGERLSGTVLACEPGRDLCVSWRQLDESVLALRTLPAPFSDTERLLVATLSSWGQEPPVELRSELVRSMRRLAHVLSCSAEA